MQSHKRVQQQPKPAPAQTDHDGGGFSPQAETGDLIDKTNLSPADVLQLQRTLGNRAVSNMLGGKKSKIQRVFQPATVNGKSHLRANNGGNVDHNQQIGRAIPTGAEVVIDPAQTKVQKRKIISDVTWVRAVDVTGANWDPAADPARGGFIRSTKVNAKAYPENVPLTIGSRGTFNLEKRWHANVGEYVVFENSIQTPATQIVKVGALWKRLDGGFQLHDLTPLEETQVNDVSREDAAEKRLEIILTNAATAGGLDPALLATHDNIQSLKHPLRLELARSDQQEKNRWNTWAQAVFAKIEAGAADLVGSINHWKTQLSPGRPENCHVTRIKLEGSDLHDRGLGAVFVDFVKPPGRGLFPDKSTFTAVLKPEDRNIEKSLFGTQGTSLSSRINQHVGLNPGDSITQIQMETHANYGSIIEFVRGQQAKAINGTGADTQAMSEGIAFAFLAGMSDVHRENVIWHNGKPFFIDADNSLNAARLNTPSSQSGFSMNNQARTDTDIGHLTNSPDQSRSAIIQSMLANSTPLLAAIQAAFTNKTGRVVPMYTNYWANRFKGASKYITRDEGVNTDGVGADQTISRWGIANKAAAKVPDGAREEGTGLVGESGVAATGRFFDRATEAAQIKADLDQGKIPFYHYDYTSGHVLHNGQVVWHGQTLAQAMAILLAKFPPPPPIAPVGDGGGDGH
jgi:hypothetical protein